MSDFNEFDKQVDIKVKKELEREKFDKKLDTIIKSAEIYPDIIKSLSGLRKSVEALDKSIEDAGKNQDKHIKTQVETEEDVSHMFDKVREILDEITILEIKLLIKINSGSLLELFTRMFEEQNNGMVNLNNPKSIVSLLKRSGIIQSWITWALITIVTILSIIDKVL